MSEASTTTPPGSRGSSGRPRAGIVSGYVWRLIREQLGLTQDGMAESFGISADTIAGWENGRRPLTALTVGQLLTHRHQLLRLGAAPTLLAALERGLQADVLLASVLHTEPTPQADPIGVWVMRRELVEAMTWPLGGGAPAFVRALPVPSRVRRGPVAAGPDLPADVRRRFFDRMRARAEQAASPGQFLLRRQALYLSGYDRRPDAAAWLDAQQRQGVGHDWLSRWLTERSLASVATMSGDRDRLAHFVRGQHDDDGREAANLNYWAYWVGDTDTVEISDDFMGTGTPGPWRGVRLLDHLVDRLDPSHPYTDLYVHTLWALLAVRPDLLRRGTPALLRERMPVMLDSSEVSAPARRELDGIRYVIRLAEA